MSDALEQFLGNKSKRAQEYRDTIEDMLGQYAKYGYAESTLIGILDFIEENNDVTNAQVQAVENIKEKPNSYGW